MPSLHNYNKSIAYFLKTRLETYLSKLKGASHKNIPMRGSGDIPSKFSQDQWIYAVWFSKLIWQFAR